MPPPLVSVIIPVFNGQNYLGDAIDSVLSQNYLLECLVIDDGSMDNTACIAKSFTNTVKYIYKTNGGVSSARNVGLKHAKGEFVAFLDHDDLMLPGAIEEKVNKLLSNKMCVLSHSNIQIIEQGPIVSNNWSINPYPTENPPPTGAILQYLFNANYIITSTVIIKKDVINKIGYFDENISHGEDYEYWLRLAFIGEFEYVNKPLTIYRRHISGASQNSFKMAEGRLRARSEFLHKYPAAKQILGKKWVKDIMTRRSLDFGYAFAKRGEGSNAREIYWHGLTANPFSFSLWGVYFKSYIPTKFYQFMQVLK